MQTNHFNNLSERELILLLRDDDMRAVSSLYYAHVNQLKLFILKVAKSPELTEDVLHDTFIKIWESRAQINPDLPFKPYLYTIAKRQLFNLLKRTNHESKIVNEIKKYVVVEEHTTELMVNYNESNAQYKVAVNSLPTQCQKIFIKCKIEGLSYKEVALEFGIAESTVNNQMVKALGYIRQALKEKI